MTYLALGTKIKVNDPVNWYNGREAEITDVFPCEERTVYYVEVASSTSRIGFALKATQVQPI